MLQVINNIVQDLGPWYNLVITLAYLFGAIFLIGGLIWLGINAKNQNRGGSVSNFGAFTSIGASIFLLSMPGFMDVTSYTIFRQESRQSLDYDISQFSSPLVSPEFAAALFFAYTVVAFVGAIAVFKGGLTFKAIGNPNGNNNATAPKAIGWVTFGVLALNANLLMLWTANTIGRGNPQLLETLRTFVPL